MPHDQNPLPPLPRPITGVYVRNVMQTACPSHVALVWLDAEPLAQSSAEDFEFIDALPKTCPHPDEPLPPEFVQSFATGVRQGLERHGRGRSPYAMRIVLRDALWSEVDSNPRSFEIAGGYAATEILACVRESREPRQAGRSARTNRPIPAMPRTRHLP